MKNREFERAIVYEILILLGLLALLTYVTRLWPIFLLVVLGILGAAIRLFSLSIKTVKPDQPVLALPPGRPEPHNPDMEDIVFAIVQRRITQILCDQYPNVRWIWENPNAKTDLLAGRDLYVLLNRAGGYRRGKVIMRQLHVFDVAVQSSAGPVTSVILKAEEDKNADDETGKKETAPEEPVPEDFGLMAFQWVEAHILALSGQCNEAIAEGNQTLEIPENELPVRASWGEICKELARNDLPDSEISETGILIKF